MDAKQMKASNNLEAFTTLQFHEIAKYQFRNFSTINIYEKNYR